MQKSKPNPSTVNPYDSKAYKRSNGYSTKSTRPNPKNVNPYSVKERSRKGK